MLRTQIRNTKNIRQQKLQEAMALHEAKKFKVGDTLKTDVKKGEVIHGKSGKILSINGTTLQVDFGDGNKYGIETSRIKNGVIVK